MALALHYEQGEAELNEASYCHFEALLYLLVLAQKFVASIHGKEALVDEPQEHDPHEVSFFVDEAGDEVHQIRG